VPFLAGIAIGGFFVADLHRRGRLNRVVEQPHVYLDGIVMKRSWAGEVRNVSLLVAIGGNADGYRDILGIVEGATEDKSGWSAFLKHLKARSLKGVELIISDACTGLVESVAEFYPDARWQRCTVHWYRNVFSHVRLRPSNSRAAHGISHRHANGPLHRLGRRVMNSDDFRFYSFIRK
jgi:transposase-like protein